MLGVKPMILNNGACSMVKARGARKGSFGNIKRIRMEESAEPKAKKPTLAPVAWLAKCEKFSEAWQRKYGERL